MTDDDSNTSLKRVPSRSSSFASSTTSEEFEEEEVDVPSDESDKEPFLAGKRILDPQHGAVQREGRSARLRRTKILVGLLALIPVLIFASFQLECLPWNRDGSSMSHEEKSKLLHLRRCTYKDLDTAFRGAIPPPPHGRPATNASDADEGKCWSLSDEVLRIPAKAIDHRHLVRLGAGYKGGVYAVAIHLSGNAHHDRDGDKCVAAMKSDHCHMKNPMKSNWLDKRTKHSCIERDTFLLNPTSFMGAEYNGALIHHALQHMKAQNENRTEPVRRAELGLLPTWGVVQDVGHPVRSRVRRKHLHGMPHRDGTIKAVIMPLVKFEPLSTLSAAHKTALVSSVRSIARAMLPAALGLATVHGMRFAYRDIQEKNIGIRLVKGDHRHDGPLEFRAFMYDQSFLTYQDDEACALPEEQSAGCNFCMDPNFHHHPTDRKHRDILYDMFAFRGCVVRLLQASPDPSPEKQHLLSSLEACGTARELAEVLEKFQ